MLAEAFRLFDKDGDGNITSAELQSVMHSLGLAVDLRQAADIITSVDKDGMLPYIRLCVWCVVDATPTLCRLRRPSFTVCCARSQLTGPIHTHTHARLTALFPGLPG